MLDLIVAGVFLVGTHFGIASTNLRSALVQRLGEGSYRALYSGLSLVVLLWLVLAWRAAPFVPLWSAGAGLHGLALLLMPLAFLLVVGGVSQRNPTAVGAQADPDAPEPATGIVRVTRHPLMWGVGIWGILHVLANGDLAALVFFGSLTILALVGTVLIDARRTQEAAPGWGVFLQATSNLPFGAILQRRQTLKLREIGLGRVAAALGLYVALLYLHPWLFGVSVVQ